MMLYVLRQLFHLILSFQVKALIGYGLVLWYMYEMEYLHIVWKCYDGMEVSFNCLEVLVLEDNRLVRVLSVFFYIAFFV